MLTREPRALGFVATRLERVTRRVARDIDEGRCNGVALRVARHGEVVLDLCEGWADRDAGLPLEPDAVFHLMSLSKLLTTVVALRLIEDGVFQFTTPIAELLPAFGQADLTTCDREPIHIPGSIQPHGVLLVVDREDFSIRQFVFDQLCRGINEFFAV